MCQLQLSLLSKGLKFCPTPGEPNQGDLWQDLHTYRRSLRRIAVGNTFKTTKTDTNRPHLDQDINPLHHYLILNKKIKIALNLSKKSNLDWPLDGTPTVQAT